MNFLTAISGLVGYLISDFVGGRESSFLISPHAQRNARYVEPMILLTAISRFVECLKTPDFLQSDGLNPYPHSTITILIMRDG